MTGPQRHAQLVGVGRMLFAKQGFDATSVEEVAARAGVSKPVVYEHFGGKDRLYTEVVEQEFTVLLERMSSSLQGGSPRELVEQAALALLGYIEDDSDGFRVLLRDSPVAASGGGGMASLLSEVAARVEHIFVGEFTATGYDPQLAGIYSRALVGMVALVGQWWLDERAPERDEVARHLVNLAWNGLSHLERAPRLTTD